MVLSQRGRDGRDQDYALYLIVAADRRPQFAISARLSL